MKRIEQILIGLGIIFYIFVFPHGIHGDGTPRFLTLETFLLEHRWVEMKYPMLGTMFSAPFYYLGYVVKNQHWWMSHYNTFLFLFMLLGLYQILKCSIEEAVLRRFMLLLIAASMFSRHVTDFYSEIFTAACFAVGFAANNARKERIGIPLLAMGAANSPAAIVGMGFGVFVQCARDRKFRYFLALPLAVALIFVENWLRRNSILDFGRDMSLEMSAKTIQPYSAIPGFSYPIGFGLLSVLLSFGKGLLFFTPGFFFLPWIFRGEKESASAWAYACGACCIGLIFIFGKWTAWHGAWFWGPRFFLFVSVPASFVLAHWLCRTTRQLAENLLLLFVVSLSVWVSASGISFGLDNLEGCANQLEYVCLYVPEFSPLWRPFIAQASVNGKQLAFLIFHFLAWVGLAWPILVELREQIYTFGCHFRLKYLDFQKWRF